MATPKEKAIELYNKFRDANGTMVANGYAKKQAVICVDEIISTIKIDYMRVQNRMQTVAYWQEVKTELNKL